MGAFSAACSLRAASFVCLAWCTLGAVLEVVGPVTLSALQRRGSAVKGWCGQTIWVNRDDDSKISDRWWESGKGMPTHEPDTLTAAKYVLKNALPSATVVDLGAWCGPFAVYAASFNVSVVAIEPSSKAFTELVSHLSAQPEANRGRLVAMRAALGDAFDATTQRVTEGSNSVNVLCGDIEQARGRSVRQSCVNSQLEISQEGTSEVALVMIEDLLHREPHLANTVLVKIDIEGYERVVVRAMSRFFARMRAAAIIALHPSYLAEEPEEGQHAVQELLRVMTNIFPYLYVTSHDRQALRTAPQLVTSSALQISCDHFDGCQVLALWDPLDFDAWYALAC